MTEHPTTSRSSAGRPVSGRTGRPRRRHAAAGSRMIVAGASTAGLITMVGAMAHAGLAVPAAAGGTTATQAISASVQAAAPQATAMTVPVTLPTAVTVPMTAVPTPAVPVAVSHARTAPVSRTSGS